MTAQTKAENQTRALIALDRLDDALIIAELQGRAVETWAYSFRQEGKDVTGLSISGVEQACRESGRMGEAIRILGDPDWRETDDAYYATVQAGRYLVSPEGCEVLVDTAIGSKREAKLKFSAKKRGWYTDGFAWDKAISKAARNAKAKLLNDNVKAETVAAALSAGRTRSVTARDTQGAAREVAREAEPPSHDEVKAAEARRRFFATAEEMGHKEPAAIHAAVRLNCRGEGHHDDDDPAACHLLSESIRYLEGQGKTTAEAWDFMLARLGPATPPFADGVEPLPEAEA